MHDPNRLIKWLFVLGLVVLSLLVLYPPSEKLKGGIDLVGGTSLLFEIDTTDLNTSQQRDLSTKVVGILRERVDPKGQLNLEWRPVGNTRFEVRMPRPPKEALERREKYNAALELLRAKNLARFDIESALNAAGSERDELVAGLERGIGERAALLEVLTNSYDAYTSAQADGGAQATEDARKVYEDAIGDVLATSLPINRITDVLALKAGSKRDSEVAKLQAEFPSYASGGDGDGAILTKVVTTYDAWAKHKADLEDPSDLKRRLRGAGVLEFRILADRDPSSPESTLVEGDAQLCQPIQKYVEQLQRYGPRPKAGDRFGWFAVDNVVAFMYLDDIKDFEAKKNNPSMPIVEEYAGRYYVLQHIDADYGLLQGGGRNSWSLREAYPDQDPLTGRNSVAFRLDPRGGRIFGDLTENNLQRNLCIILDNVAMSHAVIQSRITERGQITGNFTTEKVQDLVRSLEAGSLPARVKETPLMENTIGPSLGESNRTKGLYAAVLGTVAVAVFILFYYGIAAGGMANVALALNLLFVLAIMALMQATFTLPGIAGLILTVGMAIDASVLIFERVREERDRGVIFKKALNAGYDKAFSTIMDANITTLIICVILGFVGSEEIKGFAITLGIGISTSMFTSLFVTRLAFNTLIAKGMLSDLSMRRIIGVPSIDWLGLRRTFWPVSVLAVVSGLALFIGLSVVRTESMFDIEFLGGTSLRIDLKPGIEMSDEEMTRAIRGGDDEERSAVGWLNLAAEQLAAAEAADGEVPGQFTLASSSLTGDQMVALMRRAVEGKIQRDGVRTSGHTAIFDGKPGQLSLVTFQEAIVEAGNQAHQASERLHSARVQSVGEINPVEETGLSYEIATIETNRELVQAAILATLGDKLSVQRSLTFSTPIDENLTKEPYFVVESDHHFLADVIGGDVHFDVRRFRGGVVVSVVLDPNEEPLTIAEFQKRLREVGLQPEFEQYRTRESAVFPTGAGTELSNGETGYREFAVAAVDETLLYSDDPVQWTSELATAHLSQVEAALGQEKSLSKIIQFAPQIAGQTRNKTMFAIVLALGSIVTYLWLRFGTKEYGLAAIVALVHDVCITLGLVGVSQFIGNTLVGDALMVDAFRIDLPIIAAIMTVIGYSLNDTIVVFDRIRENKGRIESLNPRIINNSINQTLARTLLTSFTTFLVVAILFVFGGSGVHGFAFALLIGVVVGTYSSVGVATPLLYRPMLLRAVVTIIAALGLLGIIFATTQETTRWVLVGITAVMFAIIMVRAQLKTDHSPAARPVGV